MPLLRSVMIGKYPLSGKVDSGAQGCVLPLHAYQKMFPRKLSDSGLPLRLPNKHVRLTAYNGAQITQYGSVSFSCKYHDSEWYVAKFVVADTPGPVIFGLPMCNKVGLIQFNDLTGSTQSNHRLGRYIAEGVP